MTAPSPKRRLLWLVALPLLFAADWGLSARHRLTDLARDREWLIHSVPAGEAGRYAHAIWRIEGARAMTMARPDARVDAPVGARVVLLRLNVTGAPDAPVSRPPSLDAVLSGAATGGWGDCRIALTDGQGRRWLPTLPISDRGLRRDMSPAGEIAPRCAELALAPPGPEDTAAIEETFVIPADAAAPLSVSVSTEHAGRPRALRLNIGGGSSPQP